MIMIVSGLPLISLSMPKTLEAPPTCHKNPAGGGGGGSTGPACEALEDAKAKA